jgi:exosortase/archaeosortase family protein
MKLILMKKILTFFSTIKQKFSWRFYSWVLLMLTVSTFFMEEVYGIAGKIAELSQGDVGTSYPVAVLIFLLFFIVLRREELAGQIPEKSWLTDSALIRILGLAIILLTLLTRFDISNTRTLFLPVYTARLLSTVFGVTLMVYPSTLKKLTPYLFLGLFSVLSPLFLEAFIGGYLVVMVSNLTRLIVQSLTVPVLWYNQGGTILSSDGGSIMFTISTGCSSISSISVFLLLTGLMHIDLGKRLKETVGIALSGTVILLLLNAVRIVLLIWVGYSFGEGLFTSLHKRLGYVTFTLFYASVLFFYLRTQTHPF